MKVVLLHNLMAEEYLSNFLVRDTIIQFDSAQNVIFQNVLKLHHIDSTRFFNSLEYYKKDLERLRELIDSSTAYGNREREKRYELPVQPDELGEQTADSTKLDSLR